MNLQRGVVLFFLATCAALVHAQGYPSKPIRLIVPFAAGGGTDIFARVIANKLQATNKWVVVVDNKPGAGGNIGVDVAAKSPPDGYTVVLGQTSNLAINPTLYPRIPYDALKDLTPVVLVADAPLVLVVSSSSPYQSLADIVAAAKAKPGELTYATPGSGTASHLSAELFQKAAGIKLQHVPYKGAAPALTDVLGGQVQLFVSSVPSAIAQVKAGKLRAIAVTTSRRSPALPDVPTIAEAGYKGFDATTWYGLLVPAKTPADIVSKLNAVVSKLLETSEVREKIALEGGDVIGGTSEEFATRLKADHAKWGAIVRESGAKVD